MLERKCSEIRSGCRTNSVEHHLKTWPEPFAAALAGLKCYEIRRTDRPFKVGDTLVLEEWSPATLDYSGQRLSRRVTYISRGPEWGLPSDLCVMSLGKE
jgi:hypothetical protein